MEKKKLSTKDILAQARAQAGGGSKPAAPASDDAPASAPVASEPAANEAVATGAAESGSAETAPVAPAKPAAKPAAAGSAPKSTKDILAAARAQAGNKAGGEAAPAAAKPAADKSAAPKAPAVAGGAKSTKDILAAARAQASGGSAPTPAAEAAPAKSAAKPAAAKVAKSGTPAVAAGSAPSVQEMLKAFREGKSGGESATAVAEVSTKAAPSKAVSAKAGEVKAGPIVPNIPQRPVAAAKPAGKAKEAAPRRNFLLAIVAAPFALAWALMTATGLIALLGAARFMFPNILVEPPSKFKVGPPADYPGGTVSNKWKAQFGIWIVHAEFQGKSLIYALSTVCTHLGCTPNWLEGEQKFKCPCHGSGFYITGVNFEGPAPRPLERFAIRKSEDGMLEVDKSQKFQQEMGQWEDTKSFVEVA